VAILWGRSGTKSELAGNTPPCRSPAVPTALHRKDRETCHLLRSKLLELRCRADSILTRFAVLRGLQVVGSLRIPPNHPNILNWVASVCSLVLTLELNALGLFGNFSIRLGEVDGRLAESMSVARWLGSISPNRREMLNRERIPQTRQ